MVQVLTAGNTINLTITTANTGTLQVESAQRPYVLTNNQWPQLNIEVSDNGLIAVKPLATVRSGSGITPESVIDRLDELLDVEEGLNPISGSTLVYNSATDKYEVEKLSPDDLDGPVDGGSF